MGRTTWARRPIWTCIVWTISVTAWLVPTDLCAQPLPIVWEAPSGCPSLADVSSWLEAVVPAELRTRLAGVEAEVRITRIERRFRAAIRITHGTYSGEREVEGRRCEEVARSAIVVVSVSLAEAVEQADNPPPQLDQPPDLPPPVEPPVTPPVQEPANVPDAPTVPTAPAELPMLLLDATTGTAFGFGNVAYAARVSVGVHRPITRGFTVGGRLRALPRTRFDDDVASASLSLLAVGVEACGRHAARSILHVVVCARADAGVLFAGGREGVDQTLRGTAPFVSAVLAPSIEIGDTVRLRIAPELEARLVRPKLTVEDEEGTNTLYQIPLIGGSIDLGLVILIP